MEASCLPSKGARLDTVVEEALDDLLVVSVTIAGRVFRGILFDTEKRFGQTSESPAVRTAPSAHYLTAAATVRTASSVAQSTKQAATCHSGRAVASEYPVATFPSTSAVAAESQVAGKRKADSSTSKHDRPAGKRSFASTTDNGHRYLSRVRGGQPEDGVVDASSSKEQFSESLSDSWSPHLPAAGRDTAARDRTEIYLSSDSDEDTGFAARTPAAPRGGGGGGSGGVRLRGMARRGRLSHNQHFHSEDLSDAQPQPDLVSSRRGTDTPPNAKGVRLRGGRARGFPSHSHRGHVNGRSEQPAPSAAAKPLSNAPTATGVRLRGGAAKRIASQSRRRSVSPSDDDHVPAKDVSSTVHTSSSAQAQSDVQSKKENVPGATSGAGVRLRGSGVRRYGIGRTVCRKPSSESSPVLVLPSSDLDANSYDTVSASLSPSNRSQNVLSRPEKAAAVARSSLSTAVKTKDADESMRRSNGAGAGVAQSKMAATHAECSSFRSHIFADAESGSSPVTVQVDDNSPLSRSAAANLLAHGSLSLKTPPKQALHSPAPRPSPTSDLDTPLSPVLSFHKNAFKKGDVVWAKMVDTPWWPAVVESIRSSNTSPAAMQDLSLLFLGRKGSTQTSLLPTTLVAPFAASFKAKFLPKKRTSTYVRAIQEACEMCGVDPPPVPLPPQSKQVALSAVDTSGSDTKCQESSTTATTTTISADIAVAHDSVMRNCVDSTTGDFVSTITQQPGAGGEVATDVLMSAAQGMFGREGSSATDPRPIGIAKDDSLESVLSLQTHPPASPFLDSSPSGSC